MEALNDPKAELRRFAEEKWHQHAQIGKELSQQEPERLIHELEVHQIELEMQNEELRMALQALHESHEIYVDLYDLAPVGYMTLTETGIICRSNLTAAKLLGVERTQMENKMFFRFICNEDQDLYYLNHNRLITSGERQQFDCRLKRNDQTSFWAHITSVLSWKKDGCFVNRVIISDISEQKYAEEQQNMLAKAMKYTADCITITDKDFKFIFVNDSFCRTYGYREKELIGKTFDRIHSENNQPEITTDLFSSLSNKGTWQGEVLNKRKDGSEFPVSLSLAQIVNEKGERYATIGITSDISGRKKTEAILKETNAKLLKINAEKDKLFSIVAHDLRSSFSGLLGISEILASESSECTAEEIIQLSGELNLSAKNLYKLLNNLLEWSQLQKGSLRFTPQELSLSKTISENIEQINQRAIQKKIIIQSEIPENQKVFADEKMINSVVRNLLTNAVKFTRNEGKVIVRSKTVDGDMIEVSVHDTGVGISQQDVGRLFRIDEKVSSVGTDGEPSTGLGLLLSKEFIEKHGGRIWVESELGKGSTFSFCMPVNVPLGTKCL
ncbi:MAG: PAS domain-containing sensor histidine kinase [Bacteroidota bacterium]|nr:PAS domain-containing sensor histidine kinase [Bacteroidota bacterium]